MALRRVLFFSSNLTSTSWILLTPMCKGPLVSGGPPVSGKPPLVTKAPRQVRLRRCKEQSFEDHCKVRTPFESNPDRNPDRNRIQRSVPVTQEETPKDFLRNFPHMFQLGPQSSGPSGHRRFVRAVPAVPVPGTTWSPGGGGIFKAWRRLRVGGD